MRGCFLKYINQSVIIAALAFLMLHSIISQGSDISSFHLNESKSFLAMRYFLDEQIISNQGVDTLLDRRPTFQEEYSIITKSYIYHPNFLKLDLGGSVLLDQSRFDTLSTENNSKSELLNFNTRLNFLEKKPYPFSLYYDKQNPSVSTGLAGRFIQENIKYGIDMTLLEPFSPVQLTFNSYQLISNGEGLEQVVDEVQQQSNVRLYHAYGNGDHFQMDYLMNNLDSRSGSQSQVITPRITSIDSYNIDTRNVFGKQGQLQLTNLMSYSEQHEYPVRKDLRVSPNLRWNHSQFFSSFYRFDLSDSKEENIENKNKKIIAGLGYRGKNFSSSFDMHGENSVATGISYKNIGSNYSLSYEKKLSSGKIRLGYSGNVDSRDQKSDQEFYEIFGESLILRSIESSVLSRNFIQTDSIVVSNISRTQVYQLDVDYRILIIGIERGGVGVETQVQRLSAGSIIDGQELLVDYRYQTGGTFKYASLNNRLQIDFSLSDFYDAYMYYTNNKQRLKEGLPSIPLNSVNSFTYGFRADRPLLSGVNLGGEAYIENHNEFINPYIRKSLDAYIELPLPSLTNLRISSRRIFVNNEYSDEDVDLKGLIMRVQSRPWLRVNLSFESSYEEDTGGTINRLIRTQKLKFDWNYRQLSFVAFANYSIEEQDVIRRERWAIKFLLRREF